LGGRGGTRRRVADWLKPKEPIPPTVYVGAGALTVLAVFVFWTALSYFGGVRPEFLPTPPQVLKTGIELIGDGTLWSHVRASCFVIFTGFAIASIAAVPVGILMGSFSFVEALLEPVVGFMRYLPVSAMVPLIILWVGIDDDARVTVIFLGTFFQQAILIADVAAHVPRDLLDVSYTLGARRGQVVTRVLIPATLPGVVDALRTTMGWAWTYLVVAELLAAQRGLGYMILNSMRGLFTDRIFVGLIVIGVLGLATDRFFKYVHRWLLPWSPKAG
jgi:NitT/TauT family transport system permease protein